MLFTLEKPYKTRGGHIPSIPDINLKQIADQLLIDIGGKEVQEAATYSYLWLAIQVAHAGLLIAGHLLVYRLIMLFHSTVDPSLANIYSMAVLLALTALWEVFSFLRVLKSSNKGPFPANWRGIAKNAFIATIYMWIGVLIGFASQLESPNHAVIIIIGLIILFILLAIPWLRQKIIWQKSALPYVSRLATSKNTVPAKSVNDIIELVSKPMPPIGVPRQMIIFGDIGTGRTRLASAIGTELAFIGNKVRYLNFDKLQELAHGNDNYTGPRNINYWPWKDSQVLIIDDVNSSMINLEKVQGTSDYSTLFMNVIRHRFDLSEPDLVNRTSIWVVGDETDYDAWINTIKEVCDTQSDPIVVVLTKEIQHI